MKNFAKGLKRALAYKWILCLSFACSIGVASLWSANIGAFFPILEVTLSGQSLQEWSETQIQNSETAIKNCQDQIAALTPARAEPSSETEEQVILPSPEVQRLLSQQESEQQALAYQKKIQPYINRFSPETPLGTISLFVVILLISTVIKHVLMLINTMLVAYVSNQITRDIRSQVFDHALEMDRGNFSQRGSAGILAHITHMSEMLGNGISSFYSGAVREPLKIISCLVAACFISWRLLLISVIIAPVVGVLIAWLTRAIRGAARKVLSESEGMHHVILESLNCIQTVQSYCMEDVEKDRFRGSTKRMMQVSMWVTFYGDLAKPVIELLGLSMTMIAMLVGSYLVLEQETHLWGIQLVDRPLSISAMLVFFGLLIGASDPIRKLSGLFGMIGGGIVAADALYELLGQENLIKDPENPKHIAGRHREIVFQNVSFAYHGQEYVIQDVNLQIAYGEKIAIVGPNGGGKSTLTNLVCRFYDPQQGAILIDGIDLREMAVAEIRKRIGLVTQQTELFNESIAYNIRYGSLDATDEEVRQAAQRAYADEFITNSLPHGYQTKVGQSGHRLSGGQRQRIALARAFLKNPEILILDEATSQIDVQSEELILKAISEFSQDRTVLFVTHRESVLSIVDSVIEVQKGEITKRLLDQPLLKKSA